MRRLGQAAETDPAFRMGGGHEFEVFQRSGDSGQARLDQSAGLRQHLPGGFVLVPGAALGFGPGGLVQSLQFLAAFPGLPGQDASAMGNDRLPVPGKGYGRKGQGFISMMSPNTSLSRSEIPAAKPRT